MEFILTMVLGLIGLFIYFVPSLNARSRRHTATSAIFLLNLTLGWTFLFWVLSMVWSVTQDNREKKPETVDDSEQF